MCSNRLYCFQRDIALLPEGELYSTLSSRAAPASLKAFNRSRAFSRAISSPPASV
jgi:hypothetical protein